MYPGVIDEGSPEGNYNLSLNWKSKSQKLCMENPTDYSYTIDVFQYEALHWIDNYHDESKARKLRHQNHNPFFMYVSFTIPHVGRWTDDGEMQGQPVPMNGKYKKTSGLARCGKGSRRRNHV